MASSSRRFAGPAVAPRRVSSNHPVKWWLFPLSGANTEDDGNAFEHPFHGDWTIVSHRRMASLAAEFPHPDAVKQTRCLFGLDSMTGLPGAAAESLSGSDTVFGIFRSYIAVRAAGQSGQDYAEERAAVMASLLSVAVCLNADSLGSVGLWGRKTFPVVDRHISLAADGRSVIDLGLSRPPHSDSPLVDYCFSLDRQQLEFVFASSPVGRIASIMGPTGNAAHRLRTEFSASAVAISDAASSASLAFRVLRAINAIEAMLIRNHGEWDRMKPRLRALLGGEFYDYFQVDACVDARHKVVHEGMIPDRDLANNAIALAISTLVSLANLVSKLADVTIEQLRDLLDTLVLCSRISPALPSSARPSVALLLGLPEEPVVPLWLHKMRPSPMSTSGS